MGCAKAASGIFQARETLSEIHNTPENPPSASSSSGLDFSAGCLAALTTSLGTNKPERDLCLLRVRTSRASEIRICRVILPMSARGCAPWSRLIRNAAPGTGSHPSCSVPTRQCPGCSPQAVRGAPGSPGASMSRWSPGRPRPAAGTALGARCCSRRSSAAHGAVTLESPAEGTACPSLPSLCSAHPFTVHY